MKKLRIATMVVAFALAYGGSAYAESVPANGLVPMAPLTNGTTPATPGSTSATSNSGTTPAATTQVAPAAANVEPMANNGNELPLEQGTELDTGSNIPVQGDPPVKEQPVPTTSAPTPEPAKVVELTPAKVEKLPKTGDNPYTSSATYTGMLALGVAAIGYLVISRRKKAQTDE